MTTNDETLAALFDVAVEKDLKQDFFETLALYYEPKDDGESDAKMLKNAMKWLTPSDQTCLLDELKAKFVDCVKPLGTMTNVEKAKLLHQLLPSCINDVLKTTERIANYVINEQVELAKSWDNPMLGLGTWVKLAEEAKKVIKKYEYKLLVSSTIFSNEMFEGYLALFVNHCIIQHTSHKEATEDYKNIVKTLYERPL